MAIQIISVADTKWMPRLLDETTSCWLPTMKSVEKHQEVESPPPTAGGGGSKKLHGKVRDIVHRPQNYLDFQLQSQEASEIERS